MHHSRLRPLSALAGSWRGQTNYSFKPTNPCLRGWKDCHLSELIPVHPYTKIVGHEARQTRANSKQEKPPTYPGDVLIRPTFVSRRSLPIRLQRSPTQPVLPKLLGVSADRAA